MALLATSPDLDVWLNPTQMTAHAIPEDIWSKFDMEHSRALAVTSPETMMDHHNLSFTSDIINNTNSNSFVGTYHMHNPMGALPTPPHSPPTEQDLDDLVASIPEILESPSASPPSDISDILSDLEGMEVATPLGESSSGSSPLGSSIWGTGGCSWWSPAAPTPVPEESLKRDIMWGGGGCCSATSILDPPPRKERQVSECSADAALRDALRHDELSDDDDSEDNLPDTPSGTDSDCDADDHMCPASSPSCSSPRSTNSASRYSSSSSNSSSSTFRSSSSSSGGYTPATVNIEHNYCGRVPEPDAHSMNGILTPSDTEDEVDVVSCNDQTEASAMLGVTTSVTSSTQTTSSTSSTSPSSTTTSNDDTTSTTRIQVPSKRSVDVKRQLHLAIQEAVKNRQNRAALTAGLSTSLPEGCEESNSSVGTSSRFVAVKIKTQGKPAAYTKRMRDYHTEVIKSTKHRRRNRGESDEGRRSVHNSLERQRRVDLRNAFEYLRLLVPDTKILEKAPKVQILKKASQYCEVLQHNERRLVSEKDRLEKQLKELQTRILMFS